MSWDEISYRNPLITNRSGVLRSVKQPYFIIYIFIRLHLNNYNKSFTKEIFNGQRFIVFQQRKLGKGTYDEISDLNLSIF